MSRAARIALAALSAALVATGGVVLLSGSRSGMRVQAEFRDAHGLVPGNDVRIDGAPAGRVDRIQLTNRGTALVTMSLHDGLTQPRADASAAIRPVDLLGDTYVAITPGRSARSLGGRIGLAHTLNEPRLDELLSAFQPSARAGMKALLVELGVALDRRGIDFNRAALTLRPALQAADGAMRELGSQNANLRAFVADAGHVTSQAAAHNRDLGGMVDSLDAMLNTTAAHARGLDRGLETMPATLQQLRGTATRLAATAQSAQPLAAALRDTSPGLAQAVGRLGPFLDTTRRATLALRPTLRMAGSVLERGDPTLAALGSGLGELDRIAPDADRFMSVLAPAAPSISQGFFVNFPDQAAEPGTQPFDPAADPRRHYWRGAAVFTCQAFGRKVEPGCMTNFLRSVGALRDRTRVHRRRHAGPVPRPKHPVPQAPQLPRLPSPQLPPLPVQVPQPPAPSSGAAKQLLNFLLGP